MDYKTYSALRIISTFLSKNTDGTFDPINLVIAFTILFVILGIIYLKIKNFYEVTKKGLLIGITIYISGVIIAYIAPSFITINGQQKSVLENIN